MDTRTRRPVFDRTEENVGNIVEFGHVNVQVPDQRLATLFYISGLGLTRDPFLMTGTDNMWANAGTSQFHLPSGAPQVLRGVTGLVVPDLDALRARLTWVGRELAGTRFSVSDERDTIETVCPWGNRIRCHAPHPNWGGLVLGIPYVEFDVPAGTADRIARFYREVLRAPALSSPGTARVPVGQETSLVFRETGAIQPEYDGNHIQITLADFSGPHRALAERGLVTEESDQHQYRFRDLVDLDTGELLVTAEHEVRSMRHPLFARPLVNRDARRSNRHFVPGREVQAWAMETE